MDRGIVIHGELRALVGGRKSLHAFRVFIPRVVFQRGDVKEGVWTRSVVFGNVGGIEGRPAVPDFLERGFVRTGSGSLFHGRLLGLRKAGQVEGEQAQGNGEKALHAWVPPKDS